MGYKDRPYEPLDVMKPETFKRVQGPSEDFDDPNDPEPDEDGNGMFDFDTSTLEGASNAVRPAVVMLGLGVATRLFAAIVFLVEGDIGATLDGNASDAVWANTINGLWDLVEGLAFAAIAASLFLTKSRVAALLTMGLALWVAYGKLGIILGWWDGNPISGLIYLFLLVSAGGLAVVATFNYQYMVAKGLDRMPGSDTDDEDPAKDPASTSETST